jgi:pyrimidine deaminase RibD-like protein
LGIEQLKFLHLALEEAKKCEPTPTAFCVGCVITIDWPLGPEAQNEGNTLAMVLSTGFSRELEGNTHAEANALAKLRGLSNDELAELLPGGGDVTVAELLRHADVYTTMEPCSIRTSGLAPCADALITAGVKRCLIGVAEPADFVVCEGTQKLRDAGIAVEYVVGLEDECLAIARRGH